MSTKQPFLSSYGDTQKGATTLSWLRGQNPTASLYEFSNDTILNINQNCHVVSKNNSFLPWEIHDDIMSYDMFLQFEQVLTAILIPVTCIFGIPANLLNSIVFYKHGIRQRINFLLFSHSVTELAYVVYVFINMSDRFYSQIIGQYEAYGPLRVFISNSGLLTFVSFTYASGFISTLIAFERYLCVVKPFNVDRFFKTKTVCAIVCVVSFVLISLHYISTERYKLVCVFDLVTLRSVYVIFPSEFYLRNTLLVNVISGALYGAGLPSVFIIVIIVTTFTTAVHLHLAAEWRQDVNRGRISQKEVAVTKMLIAVSCLYISCKTLDAVVRISPLFVSGLRVGGRLQNSLMSLILFVHFLSVINSSFNICIYIKMGSKYRSILKNLLTPTSKRHTINNSTRSVLDTKSNERHTINNSTRSILDT